MRSVFFYLSGEPTGESMEFDIAIEVSYPGSGNIVSIEVQVNGVRFNPYFTTVSTGNLSLYTEGRLQANGRPHQVTFVINGGIGDDALVASIKSIDFNALSYGGRFGKGIYQSR